MQKDTWIIIGVMVALFGLLATFMVTSLNLIELRLTAMENRLAAMENRLAAMDGRLHEMNTRLSRIEGHLALPGDIEPIQFETIKALAVNRYCLDTSAYSNVRRGEPRVVAYVHQAQWIEVPSVGPNALWAGSEDPDQCHDQAGLGEHCAEHPSEQAALDLLDLRFEI